MDPMHEKCSYTEQTFLIRRSMLLLVLSTGWGFLQMWGRCQCSCQTTYVTNELSLMHAHNFTQLIPPDIKWDPNATPPQYTDNGDQVIEKGTHLRIKLIGTRSDVGAMFAIGSVKEDFLGSGPSTLYQVSANNHLRTL